MKAAAKRSRPTDPLSASEQTDYTGMRKVLQSRVSRDAEGAEEALARVDAEETPRGRYRMLRVILGDSRGRVGRGSIQSAPEFRPSAGHTVEDRLRLAELRQACVVKGLRTNSVACQRTLDFYGVMRSRGAEDKVPAPYLFKTEEHPPHTFFWMEYVGRDAEMADIPMKEFQALTAEATAVLVRHGVRAASISRHRKNWCVGPGRGTVARQAWVIDVGHTTATPPTRAPVRDRS